MRAYISVFMLLARSSIYKIIGLLTLMGAAEYILFMRVLEPEIAAFHAGLEMIALEDMFKFGHISWVLGISFLVLTVILCITGSSFGSRQEYTWKRLSISETQVFICQSIYNLICYAILLLFQIVVAVFLCQVYMEAWSDVQNSNQIVFLAFYRSEFLHSIMPMEDIGLWVRNLFLLLGLGIASAFYPYRQRRGKAQMEIFSMALITAVWFVRELGGGLASDFFTIMSTFILITVIIYRMYLGDDDAEAEQYNQGGLQ